MVITYVPRESNFAIEKKGGILYYTLYKSDVIISNSNLIIITLLSQKIMVESMEKSKTCIWRGALSKVVSEAYFS